MAYGSDALVIRTSDTQQCTLPLNQIDWEATTRRNGVLIDLLHLPASDDPPPPCAGGRAPVDGGAADHSSLPLAPHVSLVSTGTAWRPPRDTGRYRAVAVGTTTRPLVDGALEDAVWHQAIPFGGFFQQERHEGEPATELTEVRVLYDADNLYFGIRAYDSAPDLVVARNMIRDGQLQADDSITILLDPLHDHRTAYLFGTNPNGMRVDAYLLGNGQRGLSRDWDGVWNASARRDAEGWTAEIEIPFTTLRFRPAEIQTWGLAIWRQIARKNEPSFWPFIPNDSTFYRASQAGHLDGLRRIQPGANVRFKPYVSLGTSRDYVAATAERVRDTGIDVRYWPTPTLTTELTINTDFAQTEVDDIQINLTRFPLYYPEKRQFFLEGGRIFDFGAGQQEVQVFYPRRIGLSDDRRPVPVTVGGRAAGKVGQYYVGALGIRTAADGSEPRADSFVLRATRDIFSRSQVGGIVTERRTADGRHNAVLGADLALYRGDAFSLNAFVAKVFDPALRGGAFAGRGGAGWNTDKWGLTFSFLDIGENFKPALGFVPRPGMFCYVPALRYSPRPAVGWIRRTYFESDLRYHPTQRGVLWTRTNSVSFRVELENGDNVSVGHEDASERLFNPFPIRADQPIPTGRYSFGRHSVDLTTFSGRPLQGSVSWNAGDFYDGQRTDVDVRAIWRLSSHFSIAPGLTQSEVALPRGAFTTTIASTRTTYTATPNMSISTLIQWDSDSRVAVTNLRFNFIPKPGTDLYVVYTEADQVAGRLVPRNRSLIAKLNYIFDF